MAKQTMEGVSLLGVWQREHTISGADSVPESVELVLDEDWALSDESDMAANDGCNEAGEVLKSVCKRDGNAGAE
jgi:hypothetical protein